jgi:23S rRNA (uridine2552-2'-O)-methyltransferase
MRFEKKHKASSKRWLKRQASDPYVKGAGKAGYRSRASYKLKELNEKHRFLKPGLVVVDLGAAPGGWLQVALEAHVLEQGGALIGLDLLPIEPLEGVPCFQGDFLSPEAQDFLQQTLEGRQVDVVLSDMAPSTTGHGSTDALRLYRLAEAALLFCQGNLAKTGVFVTKIFQGTGEAEFRSSLKQTFSKVISEKPPASRRASPEMYIVAKGLREGASS